MGAKVKVLKYPDRTCISFKCPGCGTNHTVPVEGNPQEANWSWSGGVERTTITPSILSKNGHYATGHQGTCWCDYNAEHPDRECSFSCGICHSFVTFGHIQFLPDSTHKLAGKTVELNDVE